MATMVGMAMGMLLARVTRGHPIAVWVSFLSLTMFHMYGEYSLYKTCSSKVYTIQFMIHMTKLLNFLGIYCWKLHPELIVLYLNSSFVSVNVIV